MAQNTISAQQRAANFKAATRQNLQMLSTQAPGDAGSFDVTLPKARLLSKILLKFDLVYATSTLTVANEQPWGAVKNITLNMNNGFKPFTISGEALHAYNMLYSGNTLGKLVNNDTTNKILTWYYELPLTLTESDPVGLVLLQNTETQVNLSCELDSIANHSTKAQTTTISSVKCQIMTTTYTVPTVSEAFPDLSILKLVNSRNETLTASSENIIKMSTGTIYRKIVLMFKDSNGAAADLDDTAIIQLVFNQADTPYSITAGMLKAWNYKAYGHAMPAGCYVFDFATADIPEHNGSRDLVDSERLTEFWIKVNTNATVVKAVVTSECLARLSA